MIDIFMLVMVIVLAIIIVIVNIYLLAYYCAEDDNDFGAGVLCKIIAIVGMLIGLGQICLLPLDVTNTRGSGGDFRMDLIWKIIYIAIGCFVFFIIPLAMSFYECDPDWTCCQKFTNSFCFFLAEILVVAGIFGLSFLFLRNAYIPVTSNKCPFVNDSLHDSFTEFVDSELTNCVKKETELKITVSFSVYIIALLSFISYILFVIFGGVGIFSFPLDLIYAFCTRPVKLNPTKLEEMKKEIVVTAADLKDLAMKIKKLEERGDHTKSIFSKEKRTYNNLLKELKVGVSVVDDQYQIVHIQDLANQTSAIGYLIELLTGIFCLLISLMWIAQIIVYIIIKKDGFPISTLLNVPLVKLTEINLSFVAILIFTVFSLYLLICTVKGNFKFGLRLMFLGQIHPMKKDNTYMNSILFNVLLIMLSSVSVIQFCIKAFGEYASLTDADIIFNTQIKYLNFYVLFYNNNIFEYIFLGIALISFFYLILRPSDTNTMKKILYQKVNKELEDESLGPAIEMTEKTA